MARIPILKKDGTPTPLFWSDQHDEGKPVKRVFRENDNGKVLRSQSLRYDVKRKQLQRI